MDTPLLDKVAFHELLMPEGAATSMRSLSAEMGVKRFYPADLLARDVIVMSCSSSLCVHVGRTISGQMASPSDDSKVGIAAAPLAFT